MLTSLALIICLSGSGYAANKVLGSSGIWSDPAVWGETLPAATDATYIRDNYVVTVDSDVGAIQNLIIGDSSVYGYTGTVHIAGGSLAVLSTSTAISSRPSLGRAGTTTDGSVGILTLSGGTLNMADGNGMLFVGTDYSGQSLTGVFTINGGAFNGGMLIGESSNSSGTDVVRIEGAAAAIGTSGNPAFDFEMRSGRLEFIFDENGISTLVYTNGTVTFGTGGVDLLVDGSAYAGGAATFNLIEAGILENGQNVSVTLTNFSPGATANWDEVNDIFSVSVLHPNYTAAVVNHLDTIVTYGRDQHGATNTPLILNALDLETMSAPASDYAASLGRATADERALLGCNLWHQFDLMDLLFVVGEDHPVFQTAMQEHIGFILSNTEYTRNGLTSLPWWGDHLYYDVHSDAQAYIQKEQHQINISWAHQSEVWALCWLTDSNRTEQIIGHIWAMQVVDQTNGWWDRHATMNTEWARGFSPAGASIIRSFAFLWSKTKQSKWRIRAELLRDHMWSQRNTVTDLIPHVANEAVNTIGDRWDAFHQTPHEAAYYVPALVDAYNIFGGTTWINQATDIMTAVYNYGYDGAANKFYRSLQLDGTPVMTVNANTWPDMTDTYVGYVNSFWGSDVFRNALYAARGFMAVYNVTTNSVMLDGARRYADCLLAEEPKTYGYGEYSSAFAGNYAEAIQLLLWMYRNDGGSKYLIRANYLAQHAYAHLYDVEHKIFRGHEVHGYEATDGPDMLCRVLLDLEAENR